MYFSFLLVLGLMLIAPGCATIDKEALGTLLEQSKEEGEKSKALETQIRGFLDVQAAIWRNELKAGMTAPEISSRYGAPTFTDEGKWTYKSRGNWFDAPRIELSFEGLQLVGWQCIPETACDGGSASDNL